MSASIKRCPDCGGSGVMPDVRHINGRAIPAIMTPLTHSCLRCDGRGETLISDDQLDAEFPRTEEHEDER